MITRFNQRVGQALSYVYAVVAVLTFGEVCARYFFNAPTQWTIEVVILLAAAHYIMSGPQAYANQSHIRITVLYDRLPHAAQKALTVFERLVVATVGALVGYWAVRQAESALSIMERTGSNLNTPSPTILKVVLAVGVGLIAVQAVVHLVRDLGRRDGS